jgi:hypothetical protein
MQTKPIKRTPALQPLSRDHHEGLLLCWKIREGLRRNIGPARISGYAKWFYTNYLVPHFREEELFFFPLLGNDHAEVKKALDEHRELHALCATLDDTPDKLLNLADVLERHIRFEERVLFNSLQDATTDEILSRSGYTENYEKSCPAWNDEFWK